MAHIQYSLTQNLCRNTKVHIARYFVMLCQSNLSGDVVLAQFDKVNIATYTNLHIFDLVFDD